MQSFKNPRRLVFIYSTRVEQCAGIAQDLYANEPVFREIIERCSRVVQQHLGWSLEEQFIQPSERYRQHESEYHQPGYTAMQIGLAEIWRARGIRPDAVMGMCGGEFATGFMAGVLSLEHAMELTCRCIRCIQQNPERGTIIIIDVSVEAAQTLQRLTPRPFFVTFQLRRNSTIIACARENLEAIVTFLIEQNVSYKMVKSRYAPHSPLIAGWQKDFMRPLDGFHAKTSCLPVYSPIYGGLLESSTNFDMQYWWNVLRTPTLRLVEAYRRMVLDGYNLFLEIGVDLMFTEELPEIAAALEKEVVVLPTMRRNQATPSVMAESYRQACAFAHLQNG